MRPYRLVVPAAATGPDPEDERLVHEGAMPPFVREPDVVLWGNRVFILASQALVPDRPLVYEECFAWYAVS